ncbi:hypothetical protein MiAbW_02212 [Microcystis aeruginosa NIES-4325]|uniref:Uncharacterized protein n=1 Tax=Microcystis aeruginosa NIES-4325 TaxID=2569534 RepID=A0A5J4FB07_MICAE|nr:hypothetical protein MiAbW_02212 [Microcystis aeruginosa NIES-4325]
MIGELNGYKQVYQLQLELDNLEQEAIEMAKVAINLEQYLKPIIGQFQGLIDRVVTIDGELSRSVSEVESLVQNILSSESALSFRKNENLSASLLNFLVTSEEKRGRLAIALERAEQEGWQWTEVEIPDEEIELETAIQRINNHSKSSCCCLTLGNSCLIRGINCFPYSIILGVGAMVDCNIDIPKYSTSLNRSR